MISLKIISLFHYFIEDYFKIPKIINSRCSPTHLDFLILSHLIDKNNCTAVIWRKVNIKMKIK